LCIMGNRREPTAFRMAVHRLPRLLIFLYLLGIHFVLGIAVWRSEKFASVRRDLSGTSSEEARPASYEVMRRFHLIQDGNVEDGSILLFGDSLTQGLLSCRIDARAVNFGIGRDDSRGGLERMRSHGSLKRARAVVITFGINDLSIQRPVFEIVDNISQMAILAPKEAKVLVNAVLPIHEALFTKVSNSKILELNEALDKLCETRDRLEFCNPWHLLIDENGNLADEFHNGDGLHLNSTGNEVWINELRRSLEAPPTVPAQ